jgi:hypothetical protein
MPENDYCGKFKRRTKTRNKGLYERGDSMAKAIMQYPISGFSLRSENAEKVFKGFQKIASDECNGRQVQAFEKIVIEAIEKRNGGEDNFFLESFKKIVNEAIERKNRKK